MQGGGAAVSLNEEASADIVSSIAGEWEPTVAESCGPERADAIKALFADYRR